MALSNFCHQLSLTGCRPRGGRGLCGRNSSDRPEFRFSRSSRSPRFSRSPPRRSFWFWLRLLLPPRERRRRLSPGLREFCVAFDMLSLGSWFRVARRGRTHRSHKVLEGPCADRHESDFQLFGAGMEPRNGLRKATPKCRIKPTCAAARETGVSDFPSDLATPLPK